MRLNFALAAAVLSVSAMTSPCAQAQVCDLTTLFASTSSVTSGGVVYFNLTVANTVVISSFEVNTDVAPGLPLALQVYTAPNGYNGQILTPASWTRVGVDNGTATSAGLDLPSVIPMQVPILLFAGTYGMALVAPNFNHRVTNGNGANQSYSNSCLQLNAGAATGQVFAGGILTPRVFNGTLRASVAQGTYADFSASGPSGTTPLLVVFADDSYTTTPGGVNSWAWDFNGDSVIDSNAQNPSFTYSNCGYYDVSLTVGDGVTPPNTVTKRRFIAADPQMLITADFTVAPAPMPLTMAFTDTSTGTPSLWSWDFNGDNIPDSAMQNPTWTYPAPGRYAATLDTTNSCGTDRAVRQFEVIVNDDCSGAIVLTTGLSALYSNVGASTSFGWPCAGTGGSDLWYSFRAPCAGTINIDLCTGTTYDAALEVFSGPCSNLLSVACNDDSCGVNSAVSFMAPNAIHYFIRVGGYNGAQGNFRINVQFSSSGTGTFTSPFPGCGGALLTTTGQPNLGLPIRFDVTPTSGPTFITIGSIPLGVALCPSGCNLGHNMDIVLPGPSFSTTVPCLNFLRGGQVYFQGITLGAPGGCATPAPLVTTNTVRATIG